LQPLNMVDCEPPIWSVVDLGAITAPRAPVLLLPLHRLELTLTFSRTRDRLWHCFRDSSCARFILRHPSLKLRSWLRTPTLFVGIRRGLRGPYRHGRLKRGVTRM